MRLPRKTLSWLAGALGLVALVAWALRPRPVEVEWATVKRGPMRVTIEAEARARARSRYVITAPVSGRVERIQLEIGDSIRAGAVVARIASAPLDPLSAQLAESRLAAADAAEREAQARLMQARTQAAQAARDAERIGSMQGAGGASQQQREAAQAAASAAASDLKAAEFRAAAVAAEVNSARLALRPNRGNSPLLEVHSPVKSHVLRVPEISERITPAGTPLLELGETDDLEVVADVLSTDAVRIPPGARVELAEWGGDQPLAARVKLVEPVATTRVSALGVDEQRVSVIIQPLVATTGLGDGYRLTARIVLWEGRDVTVVPSSAVFSDAGTWRVFVARGGRAMMREVVLGHRSDAAAEVLSGIAVSDTVVVFPSDRIRDGARLRLR